MAERAGDRRGEDRLPAGDARPGARPRGRPRRRHGQAGGGVRRGPGDVRRSSATTRCSCGTTRRWPTSSASSATGRPPLPAGGADAAEPATAAALPEVPALSGSLEAAEQIPRRVPVPVLRPALDRCSPPACAWTGSPVVVMADRGGVGEALVSQLGKLGVAVLAVTDAPDAETLAAAAGRLQRGRSGHRRLLAAGARRRGPGRRAGPRRLARGPADPGQAALRDDARASAERPAVPGRGHAARRPARLRRAGAVTPLGGAVTGFTKAYAREAADALVKAVDLGAEPQDRGVGRAADRRDPARSGLRRGRLRRRRALDVGLDERPADDGATGPDPRPGRRSSSSPAPPAASSRRSWPTSPAAGGGIFHLLDLTPEPDPPTPTCGASRPTATGLKHDLFARHKAARGERPPRRPSSGSSPRLERRSAALAAIEAVERGGRPGASTTASTCAMRRRGAPSSTRRCSTRPGRRAAARRRPRDQPPPARQGAGRVRPGLRRQERRLVQPPARPAATRPLGAAVAFSSVAGRFGNAGPDRLQRGQRPAVQARLEPAARRGRAPAASPSTGPPGAASAWPPAARSRR